MKFRRWFNTISVRTTILVTALMVVMLAIVNIIVVKSGETVFTDVYHTFTQQGGALPDRIPFNGPYGAYEFIFNHVPRGEPMTPREHFSERFQSSLMLVGLGALIGAIGIGFATSRTITRPLNKVRRGMQKLHESNYTLRLDESESEEVNGIIREFNNLAAELQRIEELRKNVISDASHELRTPLAGLMAQLEGIDDGVLQPDKERIKMLRQQVDRLSQLTDGLQDYAYFRSQTAKLQLGEVIVSEVLKHVAMDFEGALKEKHIELLASIPEKLTLQADQLLLERVLSNLIDNAIRYSKATHIKVAADSNSIRIADDGVGIPAEHLQNVFERFFRMDKSRSRETGGMGLGLSIVKEIVEAHGWQIGARKSDSGNGVEFVITLHSA